MNPETIERIAPKPLENIRDQARMEIAKDLFDREMLEYVLEQCETEIARTLIRSWIARL